MTSSTRARAFSLPTLRRGVVVLALALLAVASFVQAGPASDVIGIAQESAQEFVEEPVQEMANESRLLPRVEQAQALKDEAVETAIGILSHPPSLTGLGGAVRVGGAPMPVAAPVGGLDQRVQTTNSVPTASRLSPHQEAQAPGDPPAAAPVAAPPAEPTPDTQERPQQESSIVADGALETGPAEPASMGPGETPRVGPRTRASKADLSAVLPAAGLPMAAFAVATSGGVVALLALARLLWPSLALLTRRTAQDGSHPVREELLGLVEASPGILLTQLRRTVGCSAGTVQHHINTLERQGFVRCIRSRRRCCVFPAGTPAHESGALATLLRGRARDLARSVMGSPGLQQNVITGKLRMTRKTARRHLDSLVRLGLVQEESHGRSRRYFPAPGLRAMLASA